MTYVPPHLRNRPNESDRPAPESQSRRPKPQFSNSNNMNRVQYRQTDQNTNRSSHISDADVEQRFAENSDNIEMSIYEEAEVTVHSDEKIDPITQFPGCGIRNEILMSVAELGFKYPTSVQKFAIPYVLAGHDVIVTSQTGSGKTAAYMLPIISQVLNRQRSWTPSIVVLVPTRELALQIEKETNKFVKESNLRTVCVYGGSSIHTQINQLRSSCNILIATPGRLIDLLERKARVNLSNVHYLVLDEADRMLDMGFKPQISNVINDFDMPPPENRQTLLFSATFPEEVQNLARQFMRPNVTRIEVGIQDAPSLIEQRFIYVKEDSKMSTLMNYIGDEQTLVFAERRRRVDDIETFLFEEGAAVVAIHGERDMLDRQAALRGFTKGKAKIMIATDVAARGIDIPSVGHVINMDLPTDVDSYIHRIGRTGRAGKQGLATSFWNDNNLPFLTALLNHLHNNQQPIPKGLEEFAHTIKSSHYSSKGRARGGRGNGQRERSYNNVNYGYH